MWLMVCTVGTFDSDVANKLIKIMFDKYFKIQRWHFPNFNRNKNNFYFNFAIENKIRNLRFSLIFMSPKHKITFFIFLS